MIPVMFENSRPFLLALRLLNVMGVAGFFGAVLPHQSAAHISVTLFVLVVSAMGIACLVASLCEIVLNQTSKEATL